MTNNNFIKMKILKKLFRKCIGKYMPICLKLNQKFIILELLNSFLTILRVKHKKKQIYWYKYLNIIVQNTWIKFLSSILL